MQEDYRFLGLGGERIFAAIHRPAQVASRAIVMCHPLAEEKLWAHRVFVSFARDLAAAGFAVIRFDFRGEGDSDREFEQSDFKTRIEDTDLAINSIRDMCPAVTDVTVLGLRLGASVAAATAARRSDVARLMLWDPVIDGAAYMQNVLRLNLMYQMAQHQKVIENRDVLVARLADGETVNVEGYELAQPLFRQASDFRLQDTLTSFVGRVLIVQINQGEVPIKPELSELASRHQGSRVESVQEEPFWKEIRTFYQRAPELTRVSLQLLEFEQ